MELDTSFNMFDNNNSGDSLFSGTYLDDTLDNMLLPPDNMLTAGTDYYSDSSSSAANTAYASSNGGSNRNSPVSGGLTDEHEYVVNRPSSNSWDWTVQTPRHNGSFGDDMQHSLMFGNHDDKTADVTATSNSMVPVEQPQVKAETFAAVTPTPQQQASPDVSVPETAMGPALASLLASNPMLLKNKQLATIAFTCNARKGGTHESRAKARQAAKRVADMVGVPVNMLSQIGNELIEYNKSKQQQRGSTLSVQTDGSMHNSSMSHSDSSKNLFDLEDISDGSSACVSPSPADHGCNDDDTSVDALIQDVESKKKRLARKAELARMSRKRKKTRMGDLEAEVERLQAEIQQMKKQRVSEGGSSENVTETNALNTQNSVNTMIDAYYTAVDSNVDVDNSSDAVETDASLKAAIDSLVCAHTQQQAHGDVVLNDLQQYVKPIMALDTFYYLCTNHTENASAPNSLYSVLFSNELNVNAVQLKDLNSMKTTVFKQSKHTADLVKTYAKLQSLLGKQLKTRVSDMEKLRCILTPSQFVKYVEWCEQYGVLCSELSKQQQLQQPSASNVSGEVVSSGNVSPSPSPAVKVE